ncbi:MAG: hypothetical protein K6B38_08540 [Ruminococcus sp.]|nr:hypothetical protein [Ruminococcus sp.]
MATKKELDDMLNDLTNNSKPAKKKKIHIPEPDNAPLDDVLDALDSEKKQSVDSQPKKVRTLDPAEKTQVFGNKPAGAFDKKFGKKLKPIPSTPVERPVYPDDEPSPVKKKKMKIVISGELPDYEAIRQQELEKDRAAKAAEEARKAEEAAAEEARIAAEKIAEMRRIEEAKAAEEAEKAALERQRLAEERAKEEAIIAEKRRQTEEKAKEEARAAAERMRLAEEQAAEEERLAAEAKRLEEENAAEAKRLAEEKAAEEVRLAEEAKRLEEDNAAEEEKLAAEAKRIAEIKAAKKAKKKKRQQENRARQAAEKAAREAEKKAAETEEDALDAIADAEEVSEKLPDIENVADAVEADTEETAVDAADEVDEAIEALGAAAADPEAEMLAEDPEFAAYLAKQKAKAEKKKNGKKGGLLAKIKSLFASDVFDEDEQADFADEPENDDDIDDIDNEDEQMFDNDGSADAEELVNEAIAAINEEPVISADETAPVEEKAQEDNFSIEEIDEDEKTPENVTAEDIPDDDTDEENSGLTSTLEDILDEDPEELVKSQSEQAELGIHPKSMKIVKAKRRKYAVLGIICGVLALIGLCTIIAKGVGMIRNIGSANDKKDRFVNVIYPAAIMDIDAFNSPSELSSEQIITATLWSIIMDKDKIGNYESQLGDTVSIPDVDVEKYAVELFGENIPAFEHCTVGPVEARFYYSNGAYNVKLRPITFTYAPDVRSVVKSGDIYTLTVDYIDELPEWMPKSVAKTVEYQLTEKGDGSYTIDSMRIISVKSSNL